MDFYIITKFFLAFSITADHLAFSGAMETSIAEAVRKRSEQYGFRFTTLLSAGDARTFNHLVSLNIYGTKYDLTKEECINHVSK